MSEGQEVEVLSFGKALDKLRHEQSVQGHQQYMTRLDWYGTSAEPKVLLQTPDANSKMTEPYLYMEKNHYNRGVVRFPLDLSCESLLSDNWIMCTRKIQ